MTEAQSTSTVVRRGARAAPRRWRGDLGLILPTLLLIFGPVMSRGASVPNLALFWATLQCAWAAALCLHAARAERSLRIPPLQVLAATLFIALLVWTVITALPLGGFGPFQPAAAWGLVGGKGALSIDPATTLVEAIKLLGFAAVFCTGWLLAQDEQRAERTAAVLLGVGGLYALWALVAFISAPGFVLGEPKFYHLDRLTGSFFSANTAASLFGVLSAVAWVSALRNVRQHFQADQGLRMSRMMVAALWRMALALLFWVALLFTLSRAAMAATAVCLVVISAIELIEELSRRRVGAGKILAYTAPAALAIVVFFTATVGQRFIDRIPALAADSDIRGQIFKVYIEAARQTPLAGHGLGSFRTLNAALTDPDRFRALWNLGSVHNIYLQWRIEAGALGAGLMGAVMLCLFADAAGRRIAGRAGRTRAAVALTASALLLIHNSVDYSIQIPAVAALWALLLGLGASPSTSRAGSPARSRSSASQGSGQRRRRLQKNELQGEPT